MNEYKTTVGLEVHAELNTKSKMFCGCPNDPHASEVNTNVCPVCLAHPGTLPVVNQSAVESVLKVGVAIKGNLADYSEFDRKNYFYPDIPKAYQISQYAFPLVSGGELAGIAITRIHLEEDTARSQHETDQSLVDFNRAGVPLMELVTEPVIHDAKTAGNFAKELQLLLRMLEVSDANMERGEMRVEANISVSKDDTLGTKVEVKNLNSFKSVEQAIAFETARHIEVLERGGVITQETRGWNEIKLETYVQRIKESADDYRYFPDPDIPKILRSDKPEFSNSRLAEIIPKLATELRDEYRNLGLEESIIETLIANQSFNNFFRLALDQSTEPPVAKLAANYIVSDITALGTEFDITKAGEAQAASFVGLMTLLTEQKITSRVAKDLLLEVLLTAADPSLLAESRGLLQKNDSDEILKMVLKIIAENQSAVEEFKSGKENALKYLVGQGMKISKGAVNPKILAEILAEELAK